MYLSSCYRTCTCYLPHLHLLPTTPAPKTLQLHFKHCTAAPQSTVACAATLLTANYCSCISEHYSCTSEHCSCSLNPQLQTWLCIQHYFLSQIEFKFLQIDWTFFPASCKSKIFTQENFSKISNVQIEFWNVQARSLPRLPIFQGMYTREWIYVQLLPFFRNSRFCWRKAVSARYNVISTKTTRFRLWLHPWMNTCTVTAFLQKFKILLKKGRISARYNVISTKTTRFRLWLHPW